MNQWQKGSAARGSAAEYSCEPTPLDYIAGGGVTSVTRARRPTKRYLETAAPGTASKRAKTEMQHNQTPNQKAAVGEQTVEQAAAINVSPLPANQQKPAEVSEPAKRPREAVAPQLPTRRSPSTSDSTSDSN